MRITLRKQSAFPPIDGRNIDAIAALEGDVVIGALNGSASVRLRRTAARRIGACGCDVEIAAASVRGGIGRSMAAEIRCANEGAEKTSDFQVDLLIRNTDFFDVD